MTFIIVALLPVISPMATFDVDALGARLYARSSYSQIVERAQTMAVELGADRRTGSQRAQLRRIRLPRRRPSASLKRRVVITAIVVVAVTALHYACSADRC